MNTRKQSTADAHTPELSADIVLFQILPRLPVKSVMRFRSVSKEWHSFLTTQSFVKMHLHHANITNNNKIVAVSSKTLNTFRTIDCERPNDGFTDRRPFPFKVGPGQLIRTLTSVHGLLCIGIIKYKLQYSDLILYNPETGDYKTLSKPVAFSHKIDCYRADESLFGLYHSSFDEDYKLLCVTGDPNPNVYIYSLKSDSWRKVESGFQRIRSPRSWLSYSWGPSIWLNENLYFLEHILGVPYSIMRFNTKTETLKVIATPFFGDVRTTWLSFTVDQKRDGCIELWVNIKNSVTSSSSKNELWRIDGEGEGNWTEVENSCTIMNDMIKYHHRLHLMENGYLLGYDPCRGCVYRIDLKTHTQTLCSHIDEKMLVWPGGKYIETLVSPNQFTE